jgi:hypothetical protein
LDESFQSHDDHHGDVGVNTANARDVLLLKCKDAIESLHGEIEAEREDKLRLQDELGEL